MWRLWGRRGIVVGNWRGETFGGPSDNTFVVIEFDTLLIPGTRGGAVGIIT